MSRQLISSDEAVKSDCQHTSPCSDCPWARKALPGWLGGVSVEEWLKRAHTDTLVPCHVISNQQCAGLAIYRSNTCKRVDSPILQLPRDTDAVFTNRMQFEEHHTQNIGEWFAANSGRRDKG